MVEAVSTAYVMFLIVSHMTVSSTMLIINKAVLALLPVATTALLAQVGTSALILWILGKAKVLTVDEFQLKTVRIKSASFLTCLIEEIQLLRNRVADLKHEHFMFCWLPSPFLGASILLERNRVHDLIIHKCQSIGSGKCRNSYSFSYAINFRNCLCRLQVYSGTLHQFRFYIERKLVNAMHTFTWKALLICLLTRLQTARYQSTKPRHHRHAVSRRFGRSRLRPFRQGLPGPHTNHSPPICIRFCAVCAGA